MNIFALLHSQLEDSPFVVPINSKEIPNDNEEELLILDVRIKINKIDKGETKIKINEKNDSILIESEPVKKLIKKYITEESYKECLESFSIEELFISPFKSPNNFSVQYNEADQIVEVNLPAHFIKLQVSSICRDNRDEEEDDDECIPPASLSGYANFYLDKTFTYNKGHHFNQRNEPVAFICDYCFHRNMWTLEGDFDFGSSYYKEQIWTNTLLTKDIPEKNLSLGFGNIEPRIIGLQQGIPLLGFSVDGDPSSFKKLSNCFNEHFSFFLNKISRVDISINGIFYKTLRLPPGPHQLDDFPCIVGKNIITLTITDSENNTRTLNHSYSYNPSIATQGLFAYSYGIGFPNSWRSNTYQWKLPVFTGSCLYGITTQINKGAFFQISPKNLQVGSDLIWANSHLKVKAGWGFFFYFPKKSNTQFYVACDNSPLRDVTFRWNLNFQYLGHPITYQLGRCHQRSHHYHSKNLPKFAASYNFSKQLPNSYFGSIGFNCTANQKLKTEYSVNASLSKNYNQYISISLSGYFNCNSFYKNNTSGAVISLTTGIPNTSFYNNSTYISERNSFFNQTSYSKSFQKNTSINTNLGIEKNKNQETISSNIFFNNNLCNFSSMVNTCKTNSSHSRGVYNGFTNFSLGSSIVYADGCFGLSRPNYNSFIIIKPSPETMSNDIRVNNTYSSIGFLPVVLDNVSSFDTISLDVVSEDLPIGYGLGKSHFCCKTEYKSGTLITVGEGKSYILLGKLVKKDLSCFKYAFGFVENLDKEMEEKIDFFTNKEGEFQLEALKEGTYIMTIHGEMGHLKFEIINDNEGIIDLETLIFPAD